jgi:hypothetical protein
MQLLIYYVKNPAKLRNQSLQQNLWEMLGIQMW